ncbi:MAG: DUF4340 domain-containing protein [Ruminococcus sp.]|nr:DUF4340 domain-containing protein [Ruminococcus sp.]
MEEKKTPEINPENEEIIEEIAAIKEVAEAIVEEQEKEDASASSDAENTESTETDISETAEEPAETKNDPLASFLQREEEKDKERFSKEKDPSKKSKIPWWIAIPAVVVVALVAILLILKLNPASPSSDDSENPYQEANFEVKVDEKGEHQAQVETTEEGEIEQNGVGTLVSYDVFNVSQIDVENQNGSFTVTSYTPTTTDEDGNEVTDTTVYTLVGFEDFDLQSGMADAVANDAANLKFNTVAAIDANLSDFGFDTPQATVRVRYSDDTSSLITVGANAPAEEGAYFTFGDSNTVYLAEKDAVDAFLYSVNDLISLSVTSQAEDVDSSLFTSLEISGTRYSEPIVLQPNSDEAIKSEYMMTSPYKMFTSAAESADIAGAIRGVYAEKVLCVNPSEGQLSSYGLSEPYARVVAQYSDGTIEILASAPDSDGNVCIMTPGTAVIYSIQLGAVEWVNTSVEKLRPDAVLDINVEAVTSITFDANGHSRKIDVTTTTESVENDEGDYEDVTSTKAECNGVSLKEENFTVFFQNLTGITLLEGEYNSSVAGNLCTVTITYSTGRPADVIRIDNSSESRLPVSLNGDYIGMAYKSYVTKLIESAEDLTNGKKVKSI